jgi:BirA family biotin operon repressor/biotin-[acetyl-CoA-carboxylase] ligase
MHISSLIHALSDGQFHSGSELGAQLGVSRTAIWKALDHLSEYGLEYESHRGKGYRLLAALDLLDMDVVKDSLSASVCKSVSLHHVLSCSSTNSDVHNYRGADAPYTILFAEQQTSGRGRRGRVWSSPFAENLYLSMCFDWVKGTSELQGLSIVVGVAVAELLVEEGFQEVGVKWPNDVWLHGKKVAGILVELQGEVTSSWRVTLGLGLNTHMSTKGGVAIDQPWTCLSDYVDLRRSDLAARLVNKLVSSLNEFAESGFSSFVGRYAVLDVLIGRSVILHGPNVEGIVRGVDLNGALLLETTSGLESFHAGELSVRPL